MRELIRRYPWVLIVAFLALVVVAAIVTVVIAELNAPALV